MKKEIPETGTCSICGGPYEHWGNNPEPIAQFAKRCCDKCNHEKVIPARMCAVKLPYNLADLIRKALGSSAHKSKDLCIEIISRAMQANECYLGSFEEHQAQMANALQKLRELQTGKPEEVK